jgi:multidrug efflux pump subunit AcrA (membrane-fusion protein)
MGMDYIPVYEGDEPAPSQAPGSVAVSADRIQALGVKTEPAEMRRLDRQVRAAGRVAADERRTYAIAPKFEGWVDRLYVNVTGQAVARGEPLFDVYSPELVSAQREYAIAAQGAAGGGERRTLTFRSPVNGVVIDKKALQGMRFAPGDALYQVADLSSVWVIADVAEQDIGLVRTGAKAGVRLDAYPGREFSGAVTYVYPTVNEQTRTVPVRVELANPGGLLKPAMYALVLLPASGGGPVLTVPRSAVIDSGTRQVVLVRTGDGRFAPRPVKLGGGDDAYVQVLDGLQQGETVVTSGNFLIDAESNLQQALNDLAPTPAAAAADAVGHPATGTLDAIDAAAGTVTISHQPIADLKWPAMTMDFTLANPSLVAGIKPGAAVAFEIVERKPGEWVVTRLQAKGH